MYIFELKLKIKKIGKVQLEKTFGVNFQVAKFYLYIIEDGFQFLCLLLVVYIFDYKIQFFMTSSVLQRI